MIPRKMRSFFFLFADLLKRNPKSLHFLKSTLFPLRRMDPPIPTTTATAFDGIEDWELCNDDGFVYKRRKRYDISDAGETSKPPDPELDPVVEERNRRLRKKRILLKLKRKYQREIEQWEILSNSLNAYASGSNAAASGEHKSERNDAVSRSSSKDRRRRCCLAASVYARRATFYGKHKKR